MTDPDLIFKAMSVYCYERALVDKKDSNNCTHRSNTSGNCTPDNCPIFKSNEVNNESAEK